MVCLALLGRNERNRRAVLALGEKGLKTVVISEINRVIMVESLSLVLRDVNMNFVANAE